LGDSNTLNGIDYETINLFLLKDCKFKRLDKNIVEEMFLEVLADIPNDKIT